MSDQPTNRQLVHTRRISVEVYRRDDGLWEVEANLADLKARPFPLATGVRPAGQPIHDMKLRLIVDMQLNIRDARAFSDAVPYPGQCERITDQYRRLVGLNLLKGFRHAVRERLGGTAGCTHLTELSTVLPTAVVQAFAGEVFDTAGESETKPFQIDRCHALRSDGEAVRQYYPRWYRADIVGVPAIEDMRQD